MHPMTVMEAIAQRRAVRAYSDRPVGDDEIHALLDAAVHAPTAMHAEPWSFAIIQDPHLLRRLSDRSKALVLASGDPHAQSLAPLFREPGFNIFYDAGTLVVIGARAHGDFAVADCWLAAQNLMLAARALGLGSCVIGFAVAALQHPEVKAELGIPSDVVPIAPIIVGTPRAATPPTSRRAPEIVSWKRG